MKLELLNAPRFNHLLNKIKYKLVNPIVLDEYIGDKELNELGAVLKNDNEVWGIQLPASECGKISNEGLKNFLENVKLRKKPLTVECYNAEWKCQFDFIEQLKISDTISQKGKDEFLLFQAEQNNDLAIKLLVEEYSYSINASCNGRTIGDYYTHAPEMQKWLFSHGYIPRELPANHDLQDIVNNNQSVHDKIVVRSTNFYIKELLELLKAPDEQLDQAAMQTIPAIESLSNITSKPEYIPFILSNLPEDRKKDVFHTIPENSRLDYLQNNKKAIQAIIDQAVNVLKNLYLKTDDSGEYKGTYANYSYCYDYADEKMLSLPKAIGAVKLFIDANNPNKQEIQELYVSSISKYLTIETDESKISDTLTKIKQLFNKDDLTIEELKSQEVCHNLLTNCNATQQQIAKLFQDLNNCPVEEVWKINKLSELTIQLYLAATTYGLNKSACNQGTITQLIHTLPKIDTQFIDKFALQETENKTEVTENNIGEFVNYIVGKLKTTCEQKGLSKELLEFIACEMDTDFSKTTYEQQQIFAEINKLFLANIINYLFDYGNRNPSSTEYQIMIDALRQTKIMKDFASQHSGEQLTEQDQQFIEKMKPQQEEQAEKLQKQTVKTLVEDMLDAFDLSETCSKYSDDPMAAYQSLLVGFGSGFDNDVDFD
ncbi:MAG: hypothetical protein LN563_01720 [Rickettsia endosymbiont of Platyusa sonomae]|nr:hypothetical protein [Rickettsia endosymbiont of Platyusa sonomae]